jgi:hypothetical protein
MRTLDAGVLAADPTLRPGPDLAELLAGVAGSGPLPTRRQVARLLGLMPPYLLDPVLSRDHRRAELSFGVPPAAAGDPGVLDRIAPLLTHPPASATAEPVGLVAATDAGVGDLEDGRIGLIVAACLGVLALALAVRRGLGFSLLAIGPAAIGVGLASLSVAALGFHLSPLAASAEVLGLAFGVAFALPLLTRYEESRQRGRAPDAARVDAVRDAGGTVAVSVAIVMCAFAVLLASRIPMVQQFGAIVAFELAAAGVASIALLPACAAVFDEMRSRPMAIEHPGPRVIEAGP